MTPDITDPNVLAAGLREWAAKSDKRDKAAVELLIAQGDWLERDDFAAACVHWEGQMAFIRWRDARAWLTGDVAASGGQTAILQVACLLGDDEFRLCRLDYRNARLVVEAVARSFGIELTL